MTDRNMTGIERRGKDFAIVHFDDSGTKSEIVLSEVSILSLGRAFPRLLREQRALMTTEQMALLGIEPVSRGLVVRAQLNVDLHGSEVLLEFEDEEGNRSSYGVAPPLAKEIGERLIARASEVESASRSKQ